MNSNWKLADDPPGGHSIERYSAEIHADLRTIQSRHWWSWSNMVLVVFLLTGAFISSVLPSILREDTSHQADLNIAVRGLIGLILLFNIYSLWQQIRIKRLCDQVVLKQADAESLYKLAMFDSLTGLYNRRFAEPWLEAEVARSQRTGNSLTLLLLDMDGFKQINDLHGHPAGDAALQALAERLKKACRASDLVARLGGDEFLLLLSDCDEVQVRRVLDRLTAFDIEVEGKKIRVAFSVGWKQWQPGENHKDLLEAADRACYENKRAAALSRTRIAASLHDATNVHL